MKEHKPPIERGRKYGRWTWHGGPPERREGGHYYYPLRCDCGTSKMVCVTNVAKGKSTSCGCFNSETLSDRGRTHGKRSDPVYPVWNMMVQRCHNPRYRLYADYGGRGIKVCRAWRKFEGFYRDMGDPPFTGATLERKNNSRGYSKSNCVWSTRQVQNMNRRNTVMVRYLGRVHKLRELTGTLGLNNFKVYQRIHTYGWTVARAIETP